MLPLSVFICHAPHDELFARELSEFLERGTTAHMHVTEGQIQAHEDLLQKLAQGLQFDVILVILSPDSTLPRWPLEEWKSAFYGEPDKLGVDLATVLTRQCKFPELLRRRNFFEVTENRLQAFRSIKCWLLARRPAPQELFFAPQSNPRFAGRTNELEALRRSVADSPGLAVVSAPPGYGKTSVAVEFAWRCRKDFEGVFWLHCRDRSQAGLAGDLAAQLGLRLEGSVERNLADLRSFCSQRRCLLVLDEGTQDSALSLDPGGKASVLITTQEQDIPGNIVRIAAFSGLRPALDAASEHGRRLLEALAAGPPSGFSAGLAAEVAGIDLKSAVSEIEDLVARDLVTSAAPERYGIPDLLRSAVGEPPHRRYAQVLQRFSSPTLPDLAHALRWALTQKDPEAWNLGCVLARRLFSLAREQGRLAESNECAEALFYVAEQRGDRRMLDDCAWERIWILEQWGRSDEALKLEHFRRGACPDQMIFDFVLP